MRARIIVFTALALLLAGCGGDTSSPTLLPTATPPGTSATPALARLSPTAPPATRSLGSATAVRAMATAATPQRSPAVTRTAAGSSTRVATAAAATRTTPPPTPTVTASPIAFGPAPWSPGEQTVYSIQERATGRTVGQASYTLGGEFEASTISARVTIDDTRDRWQIGFDTRTLEPITEFRTIVTARGTTEVLAEFRDGAVTIVLTTDRGDRRLQFGAPPVYYASDQLPLILRALPFATGYRGTLTAITVQDTLAPVAVTVVVAGQETVATPLGQILAWRVETNVVGGRQILWYGVDAPHHLVRHDIEGYTFLLAEAP